MSNTMQTFLPHPGFLLSAQVLDNQRLGKQRVEAKQLYLALTQPGYGWSHHPAAKMWRGYEGALACYGAVVCIQWRGRGYNDSLLDWFLDRMHGPLPPWLGDAAFHASHRSNLLRKDPVHYGQFGWSEPDDLPYVWPAPSAQMSAAEPTGVQL